MQTIEPTVTFFPTETLDLSSPLLAEPIPQPTPEEIHNQTCRHWLAVLVAWLNEKQQQILFARIKDLSPEDAVELIVSWFLDGMVQELNHGLFDLRGHLADRNMEIKRGTITSLETTEIQTNGKISYYE